MHHNESGGRYWERLYDEHPDFQLALLDGDELVAELHSLPLAWDGTRRRPARRLGRRVHPRLRERPRGGPCSARSRSRWRPSGRAGSSRRTCSRRCATRRPGAASASSSRRSGRRSSALPADPDRAYSGWRRADGSHFDPWLRVHERVGGELIAPAPESMVIEAPVADWEEWTGSRSPTTATTSCPACSRRSSVATGSAATSSRTSGSVHEISV